MRALLLALMLLCVLPCAQARPALPGPLAAPVWGQLTPRQQADLAWLERDWDRMPPERRARILHRWQRWQRLPPDEQRALREGRRNFREMSPRQRERMRESFRALRRLPPEEQQRLRALWRGMTPEQRREWLRRGGPGLAEPPQARDRDRQAGRL
jgi:hypothetical protein